MDRQLHLSTGLWMTALLYVLFLTLCLVGVRDWRRELRRREERAADPDDPDAPAPVSRLVEEHES